MKGIVLAGGTGTRLFPLTAGTSKQLLPIYKKPLIYYPLSTLMLAGINEILIISTQDDIARYHKLLDNGHRFGLKISYTVQPSPDGLAQAFILGEDFIGSDSCAMVLGDNIFYGSGLESVLMNAAKRTQGATIFGYRVEHPESFGVIEFDEAGKVISLEEKPAAPKSQYAATGLYFYDNKVVQLAKSLKPSARGELEITDLNKIYLDNGDLAVELLGQGYAWFDAGTADSLLNAANFVMTLEKYQGIHVGSPEEIALSKGWINKISSKRKGDNK